MGQPVPFELDRVTSEPLATGVAVAAASAATTLQVDWNGDFTDLPGKLSLNDVTYTYTAKPDDASLVLSAGLSAAAVVGDTVFALTADGKQQRELKAWMRSAGSTEPVPYRVDTALEDKVNVSTPSGTMLLVDEDSMAVVGPLDRATPADLTNAINTPPSPLKTDGLAPAATPDPIVYGAIGGLALILPAVTNPDPVTMKVWVSTSSPVDTTGAPTYAVQMPPGGKALQPITSVNGVKPAMGTTYYIRTRADDADGPGPVSSQVSASPVAASGAEVVITVDTVIADQAFINKLATIDFSTINLTSVNIAGGAINIASVVGSTINESFSGTALPSGWTYNRASVDATTCVASVVNSGVTGMVGSTLKINMSEASTSSFTFGQATIALPITTADFTIEARYRMTGTNADLYPGERCSITFGARSSLRGGFSDSGFPAAQAIRGIGLTITEGGYYYLYAGDGTSPASQQPYYQYPIQANGAGEVFQRDSWYQVRLQVRGGVVSTKLWREGTTEPDWTVRQGAFPITNPGYAIIYAYKDMADPGGTNASRQRTAYIDNIKVVSYSSGFVVLPDGTGDWPVVLDPIRARVTSLEKTSTANASPTSPFDTTMVVARTGNQVSVVAGSFTRATSFSTNWTQCGTIPSGYRPANTVTIPGATIFGSMAVYQLRFNPAGTVECRMNVANTNPMVAGGASWPTTDAQP